MKKKKILICDDDSDVRARWKKKLQAIPSVRQEFDVDVVGNEAFKETLTDLEVRRRKARNQTGKPLPWGENLFDSAAILIVDYDLFKFNKEDYLTGEGVAYLARCYSRCGLIVALNQFGENTFDLTMRCNPDSFADLNLGSKQLANPGVWQQPWKGFRPSYWPMLPSSLKAFDNRVLELKGNLDKKILSYLEFAPQISETLPRSTKEFLGKGSDVDTVDFRGFVEESGNGLRRKDKTLDTESIARIAASRLSKWVERTVLAGQDVLVDAPHLVSRFPSLLTGNVNNIGTWNKTTSFLGVNSLGIRYHHLANFRFNKQDWLSRPAWFWKPLSNSAQIAEVADPFRTVRPDFVFAEDLSRFLPREQTREFVADLPSPFVRRFVLDKESRKGNLPPFINGVNYEPALRLSM